VVTDLLESYRIPGEQTDLAGMAARCGQLGSDPGALFGVVQGLVLHEYAFRRSGLAVAPDQLADWDVSAGQVLEQALRLDPAPLTERRPPERRVAGQCFHSAVLYCALLRNRGLPARSPIRRMPATWISHFHRPRTPAEDRLVHRAAGGYRPVHVHQHPTGPLQVQAQRLFSRFLVSREA